MNAAPRTTDDYETLRAAVLRAEPARGPDLGMLRHRGLTSWLRAPVPEPIVQRSGATQDRAPNASVEPAPTTAELTRLIAGIVVALAEEPAHG
jgi:hypothetical protein